MFWDNIPFFFFYVAINHAVYPLHKYQSMGNELDSVIFV